MKKAFLIGFLGAGLALVLATGAFFAWDTYRKTNAMWEFLIRAQQQQAAPQNTTPSKP